ncbi:amino acid adenylation domain-containing protein [Streptodolium elevatio]
MTTDVQHVLQGPELPGPPPHILDLLEPWWYGPRSTATAVIDAEGTLSHGELAGLSDDIAATLRKLGVTSGDPVVVHGGASRWSIAAMLGVLRAGGRFVPVDAHFPAARQRMMAEDSGARVVLAEPGLPLLSRAADTVPTDTCGPGGANAAATHGDGTHADDAHADDARWAESHGGDVEGNDAGGDAAGPRPAPGLRGPYAYTCFTSGSTGRPKPVLVSATALGASTAARLAYYREPVRRFVLASAISFDSSAAGIWWTLACGGALVLPDGRPGDLLAAVGAAERHTASHLLLVPSLYAIALRGGVGSRLTTLSTVIVAGESCPPDLVCRHFAALPGTALFNEYGPTECTVWSTVHRCEPGDAEADAVPIGRPVPGVTARVRPVADRDAPGSVGHSGARADSDLVGELLIAGPGLAEGVADAVCDGLPAYATGDLVSLRADGALVFRGRADRQLKLGGMRVERAEIEHAVATFPDVVEAGVGVAHDDDRTRVVAFVAVSEPPDRGSLRAHVAERLPAAAVPGRFVVLDALPRLPNGKVDHAELDRLAAARGPR